MDFFYPVLGEQRLFDCLHTAAACHPFNTNVLRFESMRLPLAKRLKNIFEHTTFLNENFAHKIKLANIRSRLRIPPFKDNIPT